MQDVRENRRRLDDVTGLYNMTYFMEDAYYLVRDTSGDPFAFIYFDIENFREYNQRHGFQAGNRFLSRVAECLKEVFPDGLLSRLHEDHFVVVVSNEDLVSRIDRLQQLVSSSAESSINVTVKAGIYVPERGMVDVALILDRAKLACESIKRRYDQYWCFFDESLEERQRLRKYIASNFRQALSLGLVQVYYQPVVRAMTGEICGYEALSRWLDPTYGVISPALFVEVLEEGHLSNQLDLYVIERVCRDIRTVMSKAEDGWKMARVSVNLSRMDFKLQDMFEAIEKIRQEYGVPRENLHIEITESAVNEGMLMESLKKFREAGYEVWMDDFGSGYSSLNNLMIYDFDLLKIDMQFLRNYDKNPKTRTVLKSIVNLAKELGIHTLAEGVETEAQYEFLKAIGCEILQGYYFGRPATLEDSVYVYRGPKARLSVEPFEWNGYYKDIGKLNVLSSYPFLLGEELRDRLNDVALAVLECENYGATTKCLYANPEFESFLISVGVPDAKEMERQFAFKDKRTGRRFRKMVRQAVESGREQMADTVINGNLCNVRLKCLTVAPDRKHVAVALIAHNNSVFSYGRQGAFIRMAIQHLLSIYTRVDLFNDEGEARNLYVDERQGRITDIVATNRGSVLAYAKKYIRFGERWRFCRFYDIRTVKTRIEEIRDDHLAALFHTKDDYGHERMELYIIIPFSFGGVTHYLSLVRNVDRLEETIGLVAGDMAKHPCMFFTKSTT